MELGLDLIAWLRDMRMGRTRNFEYVSMDYDDGAVLRFVRDVDQCWILQSPWITPTVSVTVAEETLMSAVEGYLQDLTTEIRKRYQIEITKYIV